MGLEKITIDFEVPEGNSKHLEPLVEISDKFKAALQEKYAEKHTIDGEVISQIITNLGYMYDNSYESILIRRDKELNELGDKDYKGKITLDIRKEREFLKFTVDDNGMGINHPQYKIGFEHLGIDWGKNESLNKLEDWVQRLGGWTRCDLEQGKASYYFYVPLEKIIYKK